MTARSAVDSEPSVTIYLHYGYTCADCPLHWYNDDGWSCGADEERRTFHAGEGRDVPVPPEWCPVRGRGKVVVVRVEQ